MVFGDLINTVKQRAAGRTEEERKSHKELLDTPEFIFDETQHQAKNELRLMVCARASARTFHFLAAHTSHPFVNHKCTIKLRTRARLISSTTKVFQTSYEGEI